MMFGIPLALIILIAVVIYIVRNSQPPFHS